MALNAILDLFPSLVRIAEQPARFPPYTPCWEWIGGCDVAGYGRVTFQGKMWFVHRLSFHLSRREKLPPMVCHSCDNKPCCNPEHLFAGNAIRNAADRIKWLVHVRPEDIALIRQADRRTITDAMLMRRFKLGKNQIRALRAL